MKRTDAQVIAETSVVEGDYLIVGAVRVRVERVGTGYNVNAQLVPFAWYENPAKPDQWLFVEISKTHRA